MCRKLTLNEVVCFFSNHLRDVEQEKEFLLKEYYSENVEESMNVEDFFREYTENINSYLKSSQINTFGIDSCPFVIIGSIVEVQDVNDLETYQYYIIPPYSKKTDMGIDCASCLSPLGKALLLKRVNQQVNVQIPTGTLRYMIKKIILPEKLIAEFCKEQEISENIRLNNMGLII